MKAVTTLTAIAAIIAGISIASAQNSTDKSPAAAPGSINKGDLPKPQSGDQQLNPTGMKSSQAGQKGKVASGDSKFCVEVSPGSGLDCKYASMAACEKDAKPQGRQCQPNPNMGTTGSK